MGGLQYETPSSLNARKYAEIVLDRAMRRRVLGVGISIADAAHSEAPIGELVERFATRSSV